MKFPTARRKNKDSFGHYSGVEITEAQRRDLKREATELQNELSGDKSTIERFFPSLFLPHKNTRLKKGGSSGGTTTCMTEAQKWMGGVCFLSVYISSYELLIILNSAVFQNQHVEVFTTLSACFPNCIHAAKTILMAD